MVLTVLTPQGSWLDLRIKTSNEERIVEVLTKWRWGFIDFDTPTEAALVRKLIKTNRLPADVRRKVMVFLRAYESITGQDQQEEEMLE